MHKDLTIDDVKEKSQHVCDLYTIYTVNNICVEFPQVAFACVCIDKISMRSTPIDQALKNPSGASKSAKYFVDIFSFSHQVQPLGIRAGFLDLV